MSTGSFFIALDKTINLLNSQPFRNLCFPDTYNTMSIELDPRSYKQIVRIKSDLIKLMQTYNDLIFCLEYLAEEDDISKTTEKLRKFQIIVSEFLKEVSLLTNKIENIDLLDKPKETLKDEFKKDKSPINALKEYQEACTQIFNALDLPSKIKHLYEETNQVNIWTPRSGIQSKNIPSFHLYRKNNTTSLILDEGYTKSQSDKIRTTISTQKDHHSKRAKKYASKELKCACCMLAIVTLPVALPLVIFYNVRRSKHRRKESTNKYLLEKLDNIENDVKSIKNTMKILQQPEVVPLKVEEELDNKIKEKVNEFKSTFELLTQKLKIDIEQRPGHGPSARRHFR